MSLKKVELIAWLTRLQDESTLSKVDELKKRSVAEVYNSRMPANETDLQAKLKQSERDIQNGNVLSQDEVGSIFKRKIER